ncbi:DUF2057 family protein [Vibrio diazotrophicus]|uniref:DUF2057 family protein n=1 Tax=Vibrio diazotrophicus TaxID=685 RepID=UPI00142DD1CD|nr:DUF2057 family protein [Vibrio diazotrophicus]NIY93725.1 DUF2057 family protein [Vibrio diazotrophicus]
MKLIKPLSYILALAFSASVAAKVTIEVPSSIDLLVVNGAKPKTSGSLFSSTKSLELEDGQNQIVFRFEPYFTEGDDRVGVASDVVIAKFTAQDKELIFSLPEYRDAKMAQNKIKSFEWSLMDKSGAAISIDQDRLVKEGMQLGRNFYQETKEYNQTGAIASIADNSATSLAISQPVAADSTAEEMLHFWYNKADAETKARFKEYVKGH